MTDQADPEEKHVTPEDVARMADARARGVAFHNAIKQILIARCSETFDLGTAAFKEMGVNAFIEMENADLPPPRSWHQVSQLLKHMPVPSAPTIDPGEIEL